MRARDRDGSHSSPMLTSLGRGLSAYSYASPSDFPPSSPTSSASSFCSLRYACRWTGSISNALAFAISPEAYKSFHRASAFIIIFVEIPLLLRICPTSSTFDAFIRRFATNYMRAAIYGVMSVIQWLSLTKGPSALIAAAVFLLIAALFYLLAAVKGQAFQGSKTLGGAGVAQMIV